MMSAPARLVMRSRGRRTNGGRIRTMQWIHGNGHYGGRALVALASGEAE